MTSFVAKQVFHGRGDVKKMRRRWLARAYATDLRETLHNFTTVQEKPQSIGYVEGIHNLLANNLHKLEQE